MNNNIASWRGNEKFPRELEKIQAGNGQEKMKFKFNSRSSQQKYNGLVLSQVSFHQLFLKDLHD